jgi:inosine/xanthosine triphosphate pyrophosphatase family protein
MTKNSDNKTWNRLYTPDELKILVDALNGAPSYLSKRFILKHLCGWSDEMLEENAKLKKQENDQTRIGDNTWR